MKFEYSYMYKEVLEEYVDESWHVFVSAYNTSERVCEVYNKVRADRKIWVIHPEYGLSGSEMPNGELFSYAGYDEAEFCHLLLERIDIKAPEFRLCVDITEFMRPHMMCLMTRLSSLGLRKIDILYSEPMTYAKRESTDFSLGRLKVRQVAGLEGIPNFDFSSDLMIIGAGFDDRQISEVAQHIDVASKVVVLGFPSLRADMYQQNLLRTSRASDALGYFDRHSRYFAPASDPFVTASVLQEIITNSGKPSNLYLSPLSTKAQALGFVLYYITECRDSNASVIYPFSARYARNTTTGLARTWKYVVEFPGQV